MSEEAARRFPAACVSTPHHLATSAGLAVLSRGGNAVDAAVAANLVLGVVAPYACGFGGDCFALVWVDGALYAYNGSGRAPAKATPEAMSAAIGAGDAPETMPVRGPLTITVPGAVDAWFALLERFGRLPFEDLAGAALGYARQGFPLTSRGAARVAAGRPATDPGWGEWVGVYGRAAAGARLCQPGLARTLEALCADGPDGYYRGPVGEAIAGHVEEIGGLLSGADLAAHRGDWVIPLSSTYRGMEVVELPPNSQGGTALLALNLIECIGGPVGAGPVERHHLQIEAVKLALVDRSAVLTDPDHMVVAPGALTDPAWAAKRAAAISSQAAQPPPARSTAGGTVYLCAVDAAGMCMSLIQSNYMGFGSGVTVPGWGINLQNRGAYFSLDPAHVNVIAPRKRTLHTLMPAMALRDGRPWLVFGAMGGDGQPQTHVQLLSRLIDDGDDLQRAVSAPRWLVDPGDWSLLVEDRFPGELVDGLRRRGHRVALAPPWDDRLGHAQAILVDPEGLAAASDPRTEGLAAGF